MTTTEPAPSYVTLRPEPARNRWGWYADIPHPTTGVAQDWQRVTTLAKLLDDGNGLNKWRIRMALLGAAARQDLYGRVASCPPEDKKTLDLVADHCIEAAQASTGANHGTTLHNFTARRDLGDNVNIPDQWARDVDAYQQALAGHDIEIIPDLVERICVNTHTGTAGTFDRIIRFGSHLYVADLKTGSLDYGELAMSAQLAQYARADSIWDVATRQHQPMPQVDPDIGLIIHLPVGKARCDFYWADLKAGWEAVQVAMAVRDWRKRKELLERWDNNPTSHPGVNRARLIERLQTLIKLGARQQVADNWPPNTPTFKQADTHTPEQLAAIDQLFIRIEKLVQAPFGPSSPKEHT